MPGLLPRFSPQSWANIPRTAPRARRFRPARASASPVAGSDAVPSSRSVNHAVGFASMESLRGARSLDRGGAFCTSGQTSCRSGLLADQEPAGAGRRHDDPHGQDVGVGGAPAVSVRHRVRAAVPVRAAPVLVSAHDLDDRVRLRRAGPPGRQLPGVVRSDRPVGRLLRACVDPRVRPVRDRDHPRGRGRHRDHRRLGARKFRKEPMPCRCSASTRSRTSSSRGSSR